MKRLTPLFLLSWLLALPASGAAQQDAAFKIAKPQAITLATPFQLDFEAALPGSNCAMSIDTATQTSDAFEITSITPQSGPKANPKTFRLDAIPFALDIATFPALSWKLSCPGQEPAIVKSPELPFQVLPVSTPTAGGGDIIDIRPQYAPPFHMPWWAWLALGAAIAALYWYLRRRREEKQALEQSMPDTRPPHVRALDELDALLISQLWEDGRFMEFYIRLSAILRSYFERRFGLSADRLTSLELYRALQKAPETQQVAGSARTLLNECDMVKFAKQVPTAAQKDAAVEKARDIVNQTAPPPMPEQQAVK
ncbi:MAG: hypothetical protein GX410_00920 [Elusimicrobia bacterium]|nr:hypothetical protein [Elusimicrobiota bacterium]